MTGGGYTFSELDDVRDLGRMVRRNRTGGGVQIVPPYVQDAAVAGGGQIYVANFMPPNDGTAVVTGTTVPDGVTLRSAQWPGVASAGAFGGVELAAGKTIAGTLSAQLAAQIQPGNQIDQIYSRVFMAWTDAASWPIQSTPGWFQEGYASFGSIFEGGNSWFGSGFTFAASGSFNPAWVPFQITFSFSITNSTGSSRTFVIARNQADTPFDYVWAGSSKVRGGIASMLYSVS